MMVMKKALGEVSANTRRSKNIVLSKEEATLTTAISCTTYLGTRKMHVYVHKRAKARQLRNFFSFKLINQLTVSM